MEGFIPRGAKVAARERRGNRTVEGRVQLLQPGGQRLPRLLQEKGEKGCFYNRRISKADREFEGHGSEVVNGNTKRRKLAPAASAANASALRLTRSGDPVRKRTFFDERIDVGDGAPAHVDPAFHRRTAKVRE